MIRTTPALVTHPIELPSWAFRGTDVRFSSYAAPGAPRTGYEMLADAAAVHRFTGVTPNVALHLPADSTDDYADLARHAGELGLTIGSVHPEVNLRQGRPPAVCHPDELIRTRALDQLLEGVEVAAAVGARRLTLRFVDDSPYPGHRELRARQERLAVALDNAYSALPAGLRMVVEYTVVEPCFYTMDVPDWGTAYAQCLSLGPSAQVLVDTGTYAQGRNPEFVGDLLTREGRLGGIVLRSPHDQTADAFDLFVVATEIGHAALAAEVPFTLDPGSNAGAGVLPVIRSVLGIQAAAARASVLDLAAWQAALNEGDRSGAHELLMDAYGTDPEPVLAAARSELGIAADPLAAYEEACHTELRSSERRAAVERRAARRAAGQPRLGSWRPTPRRFAGTISVPVEPDPEPVAVEEPAEPVAVQEPAEPVVAAVAPVPEDVPAQGGRRSRRDNGWWWKGVAKVPAPAAVESFDRAARLERAAESATSAARLDELAAAEAVQPIQPAEPVQPPRIRHIGRASVPQYRPDALLTSPGALPPAEASADMLAAMTGTEGHQPGPH
ncbi:MAG: L-rhamnose isomerase / sugar isomerase [Cryptosporangiaceae bacterium]|jgi:L-rhamnose isomerase/sugar isomerase|nr:L-rhamnose isomerase / sugar isomerase [Cryptosporangiaceae bacterium]